MCLSKCLAILSNKQKPAASILYFPSLEYQLGAFSDKPKKNILEYSIFF